MAAEGAASAGAAQAAPPTGPLQAAPELAPYLQVALDAAREAGAVIAAAWNAPKQVDTKAGDADLVTETDKKCEALILERISAAFPAHKFIGEEGSAVQVGEQEGACANTGRRCRGWRRGGSNATAALPRGGRRLEAATGGSC